MKTIETIKDNFPRALLETTGAFGDLGTMLPLALGLVVICGFNPVALFLLVGLAYISTGLYFRVPVPVQPLKAMAAIAIVSGLAPSVVSAGALWISLILLVIYMTGLADKLNRIFTKPIVRGIQLGVGLMLVNSGLRLVLNGEIIPHVFLPPVAPGGTWLAPVPLSISIPALSDFRDALFLLVIPQLPLTLGNSLVSTEYTARDYFGPRAARVTASNLSLSLMIFNLLAGLFSAMPLCHGAGGLTAHRRFGASTGNAGAIAGSFFILLAVFFAYMDPSLLSKIPLPLLGASIIYIGICHALLARDLKGARAVAIAAAMGGVGAYFNNFTWALIAGFAVGGLVRLNAGLLRTIGRMRAYRIF